MMKILRRILVIIIAVTLIVGMFSLVSIGSFNDTTYQITVTEKERTGGKDSKYLIFGEDENGNSCVFENTDNMLRGKFDSSNIYGKIKIGETYKFTVVGFRIPFLSSYQNIINVKKVQKK